MTAALILAFTDIPGGRNADELTAILNRGLREGATPAEQRAARELLEEADEFMAQADEGLQQALEQANRIASSDYVEALLRGGDRLALQVNQLPDQAATAFIRRVRGEGGDLVPVHVGADGSIVRQGDEIR